MKNTFHETCAATLDDIQTPNTYGWPDNVQRILLFFQRRLLHRNLNWECVQIWKIYK